MRRVLAIFVVLTLLTLGDRAVFAGIGSYIPGQGPSLPSQCQPGQLFVTTGGAWPTLYIGTNTPNVWRSVSSHPVGSILITVTDTNPGQALFDGTWTLLGTTRLIPPDLVYVWERTS